ncbi:M4 thermolysin family metalloprotease precursor [Flavobacterium saliperosum S13]|uniref:Por secretion system C-terminal sorting domain-containing protein n=2 Tax=Flavobacterium saliperosum TaxID=329186 RepID=A0A1G4VHV3_9FLAO|nr:M4 family metallopeptidase [Flavobacterium saliperosum]ESU25739.1 M4 thermolysin family metalloprotease precursor [Flavobacterium saliperosum S13]SCX06226.1 Por secretion system C-terminal sorting domain-containing protein [Flavobacterium saliperosum]
MKKKYFLALSLSLSLIASLQAQDNQKVSDDRAYQKIKTFENPLPKDAAIGVFVKENKLGRGYVFQPKKENTDKNGNVHQRHQQYFNGLKVEFGTIITHSSEGKVYTINGELYNASNLNIVPTLTKEQGFQKAIAFKNAKKYLWEDASQAQMMDYKKPEGELLILPNVKTGGVNLAYKYDVYTIDPISRDEIYVDAHTGVILYKNPVIKHADKLVSSAETKAQVDKMEMLVAGTAATRYSGSKTIETTFDTGLSKYVLLDNTRGNGIVTYNCQKTTTYQSTHFQDNDNNWTSAEFANINKDNGALDAHWGAEMTYDFWQNIFGRNSFDDNGAQIRSYVHYRQVANQNLVNAFWNGSVMTYGDGNSTVNILTSIDVCGHEIGHAICSYTADLAYQNQSGGINEGYSDIWGACIEHYGRTGSLSGTPVANVWKIAEDLSSTGTPFRSMSSPRTYGNPDTYLGQYWTPTGDEAGCVPASGNDQCGVHNNSGVMNHWFYILTVGKSGTNNAPVPDTYNVTGIGMAKSSEIAYLAERDYLTPNSTYLDVRNATLQVAGDLYCPNSPEVIAVTNAWYAVNVGEQYVGYPTDVAVKSVSGSLNVACGTAITPTIRIENAGTGTTPITTANVSYTIDGGPATNLVWNGNLGICQSDDFTFPIGTLSRGTHVLSVTTTISGDGNSANNTKSAIIIVNDAGVVNQINSFESATDVLVSVDDNGTNNLWQRGTSTKTQLSNAVAGNSKVYATNLGGLYTDGTKSYLVSQCYDLTSVQNPMLKFDMAYDLETDWDLAYMQYSTDGGANWTALGTGVSANWYTSSRTPNGSDCFNCIGGQWTGEAASAHPAGGTNGQKRPYSFSLASFGNGGATPQSNIIFRFVFHSDEAVQEEGVIIDNFVIEGTLSTSENNFETFNVWPNPSNGNVNIQLNTSDKVNVTLFDIRGRKVYNNVFTSSGAMFSQEVNFNSLEKGIYLLNVESEGKKATKKLIIN